MRLLARSTISHYRIVRKLGSGGMGEVFLAEDTTLGRKVAIKMLLERSVESDLARRRLINEAKAAAALDHPTSARSTKSAKKTTVSSSSCNTSTARVWPSGSDSTH